MPTRTTIFATNDNVTANDLNSLAGAWNSYTPQVDQGVTTNIAKTVTYAKYLQFGKRIECQVVLAMTGTGTAGSQITITLPVTAARSTGIIGVGQYSDFGTMVYSAAVVLTTATQVVMVRPESASGNIGANPNIAIASGDGIGLSITYEAA